MDLYGRNVVRTLSNIDRPPDWSPPAHDSGLEESMRQLGLWGKEFYPERNGVVDCVYYMRTGSCGYGSKCRYNHPRDRLVSVGGVVRVGPVGQGEYPERLGEQPCQYYLRTGTCKFAAACKFHHPRNPGGSLSNVPLNIHGFPLRPEEKECTYYLKTGHCKFGITCKFNHPPTGSGALAQPVVSPARPFYPTVQSPAGDQFGGGSSSGYRVARPPLVSGSYVPGAYGTMLLPPGVVPVQNWSPYSGVVSPALSPSAQPSIGGASAYGMATQISSSSPASAYRGPSPYSPLQNPNLGGNNQSHGHVFGGGEIRGLGGDLLGGPIIFPVRPGQIDCQYYMKTGNCKYGLACKFHHPPDWAASLRNCALSPVGLPLRPGVQACSFYLQNGHCKFGPTCKFDHPTGPIRHNSSASSPMGVNSSSMIPLSELIASATNRDPILSATSSVNLMFSPPQPPPQPPLPVGRPVRQGEIRRSI